MTETTQMKAIDDAAAQNGFVNIQGGKSLNENIIKTHVGIINSTIAKLRKGLKKLPMYFDNIATVTGDDKKTRENILMNLLPGYSNLKLSPFFQKYKVIMFCRSFVPELFLKKIELIITEEDKTFFDDLTKRYQLMTFDNSIELKYGVKARDHPVYLEWLKNIYPDLYTTKMKMFAKAKDVYLKWKLILANGPQTLEDLVYLYMVESDKNLQRYIMLLEAPEKAIKLENTSLIGTLKDLVKVPLMPSQKEDLLYELYFINSNDGTDLTGWNAFLKTNHYKI